MNQDNTIETSQPVPFETQAETHPPETKTEEIIEADTSSPVEFDSFAISENFLGDPESMEKGQIKAVAAIEAGKNVHLSGGAAVGKTTTINAISKQLSGKGEYIQFGIDGWEAGPNQNLGSGFLSRTPGIFLDPNTEGITVNKLADYILSQSSEDTIIVYIEEADKIISHGVGADLNQLYQALNEQKKTIFVTTGIREFGKDPDYRQAFGSDYQLQEVSIKPPNYLQQWIKKHECFDEYPFPEDLTHRQVELVFRHSKRAIYRGCESAANSQDKFRTYFLLMQAIRELEKKQRFPSKPKIKILVDNLPTEGKSIETRMALGPFLSSLSNMVRTYGREADDIEVYSFSNIIEQLSEFADQNGHYAKIILSLDDSSSFTFSLGEFSLGK